MKPVAIGNLVSLFLYGRKMFGIVEHVTDVSIKVRWEDGCTGFLFWDKLCAADANQLVVEK